MGVSNPGRGGAAGLVSSIQGAGHSWFAGFGATDPDNALLTFLGGLLDATVANTAQSGAMYAATAADGGVAKILQSAVHAPPLTAGPYFGAGGLKILTPPLNEKTLYGDSAAIRALVENCLTCAMAAVRAARIIGHDAVGLSYSGVGADFADTTVSYGTGYHYWTDGAFTGYVDVPLDAAYNGEPLTVLVPMAGAGTVNGRVRVYADPAGANTLLGTYDPASNDTVRRAASRDVTTCLRIPDGADPATSVIRVAVDQYDGTTYATFGGLVIEHTLPLYIPLLPHRPSAAEPNDFTWTNDRVAAVLGDFANVRARSLSPAVAPNWGTASETDDERFWFDGAHLNDAGQRRAAAFIADDLAGWLDAAMLAG